MLIDELVNLKLQISRSYTLIDPKKNLKSKTQKRVKPSEKAAIEIEQNFPDLMNLTSIESMMFAIDKSEMHQKSITMIDDQSDFVNRSSMIPIDFDYTMDQFGPASKDESNFLLPMIEDYTIARMENDKQVESLIDYVQDRPGVTSTGRKPERPSGRLPFTDLSNLTHEEQRHELVSDLGGFNEQTVVGRFDVSSKIPEINIGKLIRVKSSDI